MRSNGKQAWDWEQSEKLAGLYFAAVAARAGVSGRPTPFPIDEIAAEMGRTVDAVQGEIHRRGMSAPGASLAAAWVRGAKAVGNSSAGDRATGSASAAMNLSS